MLILFSISAGDGSVVTSTTNEKGANHAGKYNVEDYEDESSDYRNNHLGDRVRETIVSRNAE